MGKKICTKYGNKKRKGKKLFPDFIFIRHIPDLKKSFPAIKYEKFIKSEIKEKK